MGNAVDEDVGETLQSLIDFVGADAPYQNIVCHLIRREQAAHPARPDVLVAGGQSKIRAVTAALAIKLRVSSFI